MKEKIIKIDLKEKYKNEVIPKMMEKFGYSSPMAVPRIEKVVLNAGIGKILGNIDASKREKAVEDMMADLALISGQKPIPTRAKKSISGFKVKKGAIVGLKVTLRRKRMYDFLARLIHLALPRVRDFQGISPDSFDQDGNLTIGIREHIVFPEIKPEKSKIHFGFEVCIVTTTKNKEESIELLKLLGFPIKEK